MRVLLFSALFLFSTPTSSVLTEKINKDIITIAKVVFAECSYCPETDKILIASSILNRVENKDFPKTIDSVIYKQYSISDTFNESSYKIAHLVYNDVIREKNVLYFYNPKLATDIKFMRLMEYREAVCKTKYHNYYK